jgi:cytochrome c oxidase assembly protein subunit 11
MQTSAQPSRIKRLNWHMVKKLSVIVALMFGFGYALVPMYSAICNALGINILSRSELQTYGQGGGSLAANTQIDTSRTITVEFDANARGPWHFKPATRTMQVHPGELSTVMYQFQNIQNRTMAAHAVLQQA